MRQVSHSTNAHPPKTHMTPSPLIRFDDGLLPRERGAGSNAEIALNNLRSN